MAHAVEESFVVLRHILEGRYLPLVQIAAVHIVKEKLRSGQQGIFYQNLLADTAAHQMKSIHMVLQLPVMQDIQHYRGAY